MIESIDIKYKSILLPRLKSGCTLIGMVSSVTQCKKKQHFCQSAKNIFDWYWNRGGLKGTVFSIWGHFLEEQRKRKMFGFFAHIIVHTLPLKRELHFLPSLLFSSRTFIHSFIVSYFGKFFFIFLRTVIFFSSIPYYWFELCLNRLFK